MEIFFLPLFVVIHSSALNSETLLWVIFNDIEENNIARAFDKVRDRSSRLDFLKHPGCTDTSKKLNSISLSLAVL